MAEQWYYGKDGSKVGPFTGRELRELAACGLLLPGDTVWQVGIPMGVPARRVKGLFRAAPGGAGRVRRRAGGP